MPVIRENYGEIRNRMQPGDVIAFSGKGNLSEVIPQAIRSALDTLDGIPLLGRATTQNVEDFSQFFCSELVAAGLEAGGVIESINASEVTPVDLCRFNLYADEYVQFRGEEEPKEIHRFNSIDPTGWGE